MKDSISNGALSRKISNGAGISGAKHHPPERHPGYADMQSVFVL